MNGDFGSITTRNIPEISKLNILNYFLGHESLSASDKTALIYEKNLEEVIKAWMNLLDSECHSQNTSHLGIRVVAFTFRKRRHW